jgi:hypothetical protein
MPAGWEVEMTLSHIAPLLRSKWVGFQVSQPQSSAHSGRSTAASMR